MKKKIFATILSIAIFGSFLLVSQAETAEQYEHILNFNSDITVNKDSTLDVTEKITVYANNEQINHGIFRDFPTIYKDDYGNNYKIKFSITSVKKDGQEEQYKTENLSNGVRVYIGQADVIISPGPYTYEISYNVNKELGFFEKEDVLYWNVTGNGWPFNIDKVEATVHLPEGVSFEQLSASAYTGFQGSKAQDFYSTTTKDTIYFSTTKILGSQEGLTIAVGWPKGFVIEPTAQDKMFGILTDNIGVMFGIISFIIVLLYFTIVWIRFGRDPRKGSIIAEYEAPENLSPASLRFNFIEGYDNSAFTATIINMAVKGCLIIEQTSMSYKLTKTGKNKDKLSDEETIVFDIIFASGDEVSVSQSNYKKFENAQLGLKKYLDKTFLGSYFINNGKVTGIGSIISLFLLFITSILVGAFPDAIFLSIWVSLWTIGTIVVLFGVYNYKKAERKKVPGIFISAIILVLGEIIGVGALIQNSSVFYTILLVCFMAINIIFFKALKQRTKIGRKLEDKIEGFKLFLSVTEEARLNFANPPEKTPELFEKFLPYALALGVEQNWAEQFNNELNMSDENAGNAYHPVWFIGSKSASFTSVGEFTNSISSSLSSHISSSSHAPGSGSGGGSSSSHGGGSSGGGGGGGGGGGW